MDNVTHTLFAATLARTPLGRAGRGTLTALVIASNAPDVDIIATAGGTASYLKWHRGPTHGPLGIVALGLATAAIVWLGRRAWDRRKALAPGNGADNATFGMLAAVSTIGVLLHVLMDLPTSYGTRIFSPFDWHWYAVDWMPIVDVYLLMAFAVGLIFGEFSKSSRRRLAAILLAAMAANYGVRAIAHRQALALAPRLFGPILPQPCAPDATNGFGLDRWPRDPVATTGRPCLVEIAAVPTFFSPFRWRIVAQTSNAYELHELDVLDARFRTPPTAGEVFWRRAVRYPNQWSEPTFRAAATPIARTFLGFSRFPAARTFSDPAGASTVRWSDMRFVGGMVTDDVRPPSLFNVMVRIAPDGSIQQEAIGR